MIFVCIAALAVWVAVLILPVALVLWAGISWLWVLAGAIALVTLIWATLLLVRKPARSIPADSGEFRPVPAR
jgi:type VI protein secretion system component VasK